MMGPENKYRTRFLRVIFLTTFTVSLHASPIAELDCPELKSADQALDFFLTAEHVGARLSSETASNLRNCISFDDQNAWDKLTIIRSSEAKPCAKETRSGASCFEVKFLSLGDLYPQKTFQKNTGLKAETLNLKIRRLNDKWTISGLSEHAPIVKVEEAVKFLETQRKLKNNSGKKSEWIESSLKELEKL